ncbi:hypothetical protein Q6348_08845 [Isoptericola sp. b441]|uniref:Uncharacterized protein n=1 Tax=Actinotalea lenta TaxID=3064654 RepID=A0ABT9D8S1_9CELL|nr:MULTISPECIES: hypothetical protein [unclassified Isoptericola]MDO8107299.1 hypothetical protein [Isoptericola sp. b441]MDO8121039.1 hypothetical protein [Isoptericola sp. b490]
MTGPDDVAARLREAARTEDLTSRLDTDRVVAVSRRKRTTRRAGAGLLGVGLVAAVAIAVPALTRPAPVPAATGPSTTSASPSASAPGGAPLPAGFQVGHVPSWLEGSGLACGMDAAALAPRPGDLTLRSPGTVSAERTTDGTWLYTLPAELDSARSATDVWSPTDAAVAWIQDGTVVGLGPDQAELPTVGPLTPGTPRPASAIATRTDFCVPNGDGTYTTDLPAGHYELVLYLPVSPQGYDPSTVTWVTSERLSASLADDGRLTRVEPSPGG